MVGHLGHPYNLRLLGKERGNGTSEKEDDENRCKAIMPNIYFHYTPSANPTEFFYE